MKDDIRDYIRGLDVLMEEVEGGNPGPAGADGSPSGLKVQDEVAEKIRGLILQTLKFCEVGERIVPPSVSSVFRSSAFEASTFFDQTFDALGLTSLDILEILSAVEEKFNFRILGGDDKERILSSDVKVNDVIKFIKEAVAKNS